VFSRKTEDETHPLDETISTLISEFAGLETGSAEQNGCADTIKTLMEARTADEAARTRPTMSPDMIVSAAASLLGIALILGFEKANVITSKSLSFVPKIKP
jgi:hypothetical protein